MKRNLPANPNNVDSQLILALREVFQEDDVLFFEAVNEMKRAMVFIEEEDDFFNVVIIDEEE